MSRGWLQHTSSAALAVVVAVMLWFVASEDLNPIEDVSRWPSGAALPIEFRGVPAGRAAYDPSVREVRLSLHGLETGLGQMQPDDVVPYVDLAHVDSSVVTATAKIKLDCPSCLRRGVRAAVADEDVLVVHLGPESTQVRSVSVQSQDSPPTGFVVTAISTAPGTVELTGAEEQLAGVERVVAEVSGLAEAREDAAFESVAVLPVDADGDIVLDLEVSPGTVDVAIEVQRRGIEVSVSPGAEGVQADGYYISGISVEPQVVQLAGDQDQLDALDTLGTIPATVDITGATDDVVELVGLPIPDGVTALNAPDGVTVTIQITPLPGTRTMSIPVRPRGLAAGLSVTSISPESIEVLIGGPQATVGDLRPDDVTVTVNLSGLGEGTHTVSLAQPHVPDGYFVRSVNPSVVNVGLVESD